MVCFGGFSVFALNPADTALDPRGKTHIPIGIANTLDTLKTFVEAEGNFSPGFGSYGIYFWLYDPVSEKLTAPTMDGVPCQHGLNGGGHLIPWSVWEANGLRIKTEVCEVQRKSKDGPVFVVGAQATIKNRGNSPRPVLLYVALRSLGPAGWPVIQVSIDESGLALRVDGHPALVANEKPSLLGVRSADDIGRWAASGKMPTDKIATSSTGDCSGAMRYDILLRSGESKTWGFVCPVLPGRRAVGHQWDGVSTWAQFDLAKPNPAAGGELQPDLGLSYYRRLPAKKLFGEADNYWHDLAMRVAINVPDPRWAEAFAAIIGHAAVSMNEGAPDVAVVNYNVFNRDGVYIANILQKAGQFNLAATAIDYFLSHPFNGRVQPEADNPGQILWVMGEHWLFTRDRSWLRRVYPAARKIAAMIQYYRTTPGPHWVNSARLEFGEALPAHQRQELKPGSCDGFHPEYTEAFDLAGLRAAEQLAKAMNHATDAEHWRKLAAELAVNYDRKFGSHLAKDYGSYSVLWPCRLYPLNEGRAHEQFKGIGAQQPTSWRYFPLAKAHQGLLAGNRGAAAETLDIHLAHEQMCGWYAFDEGGDSGVGGWNHVRTRWRQGKTSDAMPHGWAIAEVELLIRDSLIFEDCDRLVLLAGVPPEWFINPAGIRFSHLPTHFGYCSLVYSPTLSGARLLISGDVHPPEGFVLRLPISNKRVVVTSAGKHWEPLANGDVLIPTTTRQMEIKWDAKVMAVRPGFEPGQ